MFLLLLLFSSLRLGQNAPYDFVNPTLVSRPDFGQSKDLINFLNFPFGDWDVWSPFRPFRPWIDPNMVKSNMSIDGNICNFDINVQQFKPEEIKVEVKNSYLCISGDHNEPDNLKQFMVQYLLPADADVKNLKYEIVNSVLKISVPLKSKDTEIEQPTVSANDQKEVDTTDETTEDHEVREEVTATQAQEAGPKPEK